MSAKIEDKRYGGTRRAQVAREGLMGIFSEVEHPLYCCKSIDLARKYNVTRLTIYRIMDELQIPSRMARILRKLKTIDTREYTRRELSEFIGATYINMYNILREHNIPVKADTPPIETMRKVQYERLSQNGNLVSDVT